MFLVISVSSCVRGEDEGWREAEDGWRKEKETGKERKAGEKDQLNLITHTHRSFLAACFLTTSEINLENRSGEMFLFWPLQSKMITNTCVFISWLLICLYFLCMCITENNNDRTAGWHHRGFSTWFQHFLLNDLKHFLYESKAKTQRRKIILKKLVCAGVNKALVKQLASTQEKQECSRCYSICY